MAKNIVENMQEIIKKLDEVSPMEDHPDWRKPERDKKLMQILMKHELNVHSKKLMAALEEAYQQGYTEGYAEGLRPFLRRTS